jgi:hypothetical protein
MYVISTYGTHRGYNQLVLQYTVKVGAVDFVVDCLDASFLPDFSIYRRWSFL